MTISTVMAVRDGATYVGEALDSVLAEPDVGEVIVVDDGSTDATPDVLAAYGDRIRVLRQDGAGQAAALNRGIAAADGDVLAFQDADDVWPAGRLAVLTGVMRTGADVVYGRVEQFVSPDLDPRSAARVRVVQSGKPAPLLGAALVRRDAFRRVGPLDDRLRTGAVIDWIARARVARLQFATTPAITLRRRIHGANLGRQVGAAARNADLLAVLRDHVQRVRANDGSTPP